MFPQELQLELEYWAETGEFDLEELHQVALIANCLYKHVNNYQMFCC